MKRSGRRRVVKQQRRQPGTLRAQRVIEKGFADAEQAIKRAFLESRRRHGITVSDGVWAAVERDLQALKANVIKSIAY
jgi:hypothetical protein